MRSALALLAALAFAGCTLGAASPLHREGELPVKFFAGADAAGPVVSSIAFGEQHTSFDVSIRGTSGATTVADSLVKMRNVDAHGHLVLLRATRLADDHVARFTFTFRDATGEPYGTLDLRGPPPTLDLRVPGQTTLDAQLVLTVEDGATGGVTSIGVTVLDP